MIRKLENTNKNSLILLLSRIKNGIDSMILEYSTLYTEEELIYFKKISQIFASQIFNIKYDKINLNSIYELLKYEDILKPYIFKCWQVEKNNKYISWFKNDKLGDTPPVVSSTFSTNAINTFCDSNYGIRYDVELNGFIAACEKDAATLIEDNNKRSIYTIGTTIKGKVINSYNYATPIITPIQLFNYKENDYKSKHSEVILDSNYIKPISVVYTNGADINMVNLISERYNIPLEYIPSNNREINR